MKKSVEAWITAATVLIEMIFPAMALSLILPAFYMTSSGRADSFLLPLFGLGFILVLPTVLGKYALWKVKKLGTWLLICLGIMVLVWFASGIIVSAMPWSAVMRAAAAVSSDTDIYEYFPPASRITLVVLSAVILFDFYLVRMQEVSRQRAIRENDLGWTAGTVLFDSPSPWFLCWFGAVYVFGLLFDSRIVSNLAAVCFVVYALMLLFYRHAAQISFYLTRLSYLTNMPGKRIRKLGLALLLVFLISTGILAVIFGALTVSFRSYTDLRNMEGTGPVDFEDFSFMEEGMTDGSLLVPQDDIEIYEESKYSRIFQWISAALMAVMAVIGIRALFRFFNSIFIEFADLEEKESEDPLVLENGDTAERIRTFRKRKTADTPRERIRREYRRRIRRAKKGIPPAYGTPLEIEEAAGLLEDASMRELHVRYEEARYGTE